MTAAVLAGAAGQDKPSAASSEVRPKSFVRMDLLTKQARELMPPKRGIFSPGAEDEGAGAEGDGSGPATTPASRTRNPEGRPAATGTQTAETSSALPALGLRYIGFIRSAQTIVGLVLVQGQALAVKPGDIVGDGYKIGTITPKEIEVIGPEGSKQAFPLEGEEE